MNRTLEVRRARHLVAYWSDEGIVTTNFATGSAVVSDALVSHVLNFCSEWRTLSQLRHELRGVSGKAVEGVTRSMVRHHLLVRRDRRPDSRETALETWNGWNPAAGYFHLTTKNLRAPSNRERAEQALRERAKVAAPPSSTKRYPGAQRVELPPARKDGEFPRVLLERRTWRSFSAAPVSLQDVSTLLGLTWGVQRIEHSVGFGRVHLKTSPSSGARQPLEAYVLALNVQGLSPGLYHYVNDEHSLEPLKKGATSRTVTRYVPGQWWYDSAAALFLMTAVFARTQWRYPFARAYRSVLLEAGHACQTFCLIATWLGLAPFCTGRFADAVVERDLRIDGITESFVYGAGVGSRPAGLTWAPWPIDCSPEQPLMRRRRKRDVMPDE